MLSKEGSLNIKCYKPQNATTVRKLIWAISTTADILSIKWGNEIYLQAKRVRLSSKCSSSSDFFFPSVQSSSPLPSLSLHDDEECNRLGFRVQQRRRLVSHILYFSSLHPATREKYYEFLRFFQDFFSLQKEAEICFTLLIKNSCLNTGLTIRI